MPEPRNPNGQNAKKQQKTKNRVAGEERAKQKKKDKSVDNLNAYQTRHKNDAIQQQREKTAREYGLDGHASGTSSSKQNRGTTQGLDRINHKSR